MTFDPQTRQAVQNAVREAVAGDLLSLTMGEVCQRVAETLVAQGVTVSQIAVQVTVNFPLDEITFNISIQLPPDLDEVMVTFHKSEEG